MNKFLISGRVTKDLTLETTPNGIKLATLSLAENYLVSKNGKRQEKTNFFRIALFGSLAENVAKYCGKGSYLLVEARIENDNYEKDGKTIYQNSIVAIRVEFCELKKPGTDGCEALNQFSYDPDEPVE